VNSNDQPLAVPSAIGADGSSFSVTRTSAPVASGGTSRRTPVAPHARSGPGA
jgi:hypothetical protein